MRFLSTLLVMGGYVLVYAAIANHGKFATDPWLGVLADAYQDQPTTAPSAPSPTTPAPSTTVPLPGVLTPSQRQRRGLPPIARP